MDSIEKLFVDFTIMDVGKFKVELYKSGSARTIQRIQQNLPISTRGLKRRSRFIIPIEINSRKENLRTSFVGGDLSFNSQTSEITLHLDTNEDIAENYLGKIIDDLSSLSKIRLTHGVSLIRV